LGPTDLCKSNFSLSSFFGACTNEVLVDIYNLKNRFRYVHIRQCIWWGVSAKEEITTREVTKL